MRLNPWLATFNPESRFSGFTDIDGTVAFYLRVNALATSKDIVLDFACGQGTYANDPVIAMPKLLPGLRSSQTFVPLRDWFTLG